MCKKIYDILLASYYILELLVSDGDEYYGEFDVVD